MNKLLKYLLLSCVILSACRQSQVYEKYEPIKNWQWKYVDPKSFPIEIKEEGKHYNIYISVRHNEDYTYSNLWVQIQVKKPGNETENQRFALSLAEPDGKWLGTRLGSVYDIPPFLVLKNYSMPSKGSYSLVLRHAMRQEEVTGIMDVGIRVQQVD